MTNEELEAINAESQIYHGNVTKLIGEIRRLQVVEEKAKSLTAKINFYRGWLQTHGMGSILVLSDALAAALEGKP